MTDTAAKLREVTELVRMMPNLQEVPIPVPPKRNSKASVKVRIGAIQQYLNALEYNYTGQIYFDVSKNRSHKSIFGTAKEIIQDALPVQCLEAVFLAAYLSAGGSEHDSIGFNQQLDRIPISFKTKSGDVVFRHIVLGIKHQHTWGAVGLSRSPELMNKELKFKSLSELIHNYVENYTKVLHEVIKVYIGFPFSHDIHSTEKVEWRVLNIKIIDHRWETVAAQLDLFTREYPELMSHLHRVGELPDVFLDKFPLHKPPKKAHSPSRKLRAVEWEVLNPSTVLPQVQVPKTPLLLKVNPELIHFKRKDAITMEYLPINLYLHSAATNTLSVCIFLPNFLQILGNAPTHDERPFYEYLLKPSSIISTAIRFVLPNDDAPNEQDQRQAFTIEVQTSKDIRMENQNLQERQVIDIPFDWE